MYGQGRKIVSQEEALELECPLCLMPAGEWCVYVAPKVKLSTERQYALVTRLGVQRAGTRSKTLHTPRFNAARGPSKPKPVAPGLSADTVEALEAWRQWNLNEHMAMRDWLKENWHLFR